QQQQQQASTNLNKPIGIDTSNTDTYETLRADDLCGCKYCAEGDGVG
ncbi:unnamed protein product, partial [Rotaria magnacalcarata]